MQQIGHSILSKWYSSNYFYRALFQYEVKEEGYIMGKLIESKEDILDVVIHTIRFTYREGFQAYQCQNSTLTTDSGWGCVIRVGQMMMAELLKRHLKCFYNVNLFQFPPLMQEVLQLFKDDDEMESLKVQGKPSKYGFSIQKIMRIAYEEWGKKPGEWYSPNQIVQAIYKILSDNNIIYSCGLSLLPFYESQIDLKVILQEMCVMENCICEQRVFFIEKFLQDLVRLEINKEEVIQVIHGNDSISDVYYEDLSQQNKQEIGMLLKKYVCQKCFVPIRAVAICLLSRIGCDEPNPDYIQAIRQFMKKKYFAGLLGGRPREANFIVGFVDDKFVVLDPHLVQQANMNPEEYVKSCFPGEALFMSDKEIDCSLGLVFYLKNEEDLIELIYDIQAHQQINFFSFATIQNWTYSKIQKEVELEKIKEMQNFLNEFLVQQQQQILNLDVSANLEGYEIGSSQQTLVNDIEYSYEQI
ncbi:unnamed protein product (macronuclear) [Paramecium tetraurelia]|uniref:Cysteine protease n=1 Tax=Paramecium tetraurelia TaxID=5888 RepID=A0CCT8_PARTE|nr:uncharacterized protein GSPATT00037390001 [Paramecium tetraurelia]CAK68605.1 unnamed protein product [Paramecium tetraurelia]|eukprot:XP_001436002.1 hypothetical protein (macronuclear) [Paramecium tetraurelia strain d4-2]